MIKNYFKIAFRNLRKNKIFSFINVFGLAIGLTCFMFIVTFIYNELSFDQYPTDAKDIYRINLSVTGNGNVAVYPNVDVAVGKGIKNAFPEVEAFARLLTLREFITYDNKQFKEEHIAFADSNFLQMFSIPLIEGNISEALMKPNSIVISKAFEKKYFGKDEAVGKTLTIGTRGTVYKVTGVIDKVPDNSHFHFDAFLSLTTLKMKNETWSNLGFYTYLLLNKNADPKKLETKFPQLVENYVVPEIRHDMGISLAEAQKSVNTFVFSLQPLTDIHLNSNTEYELEANGDQKYVYIFSALAIFILLLACINFTNLSIAMATKRLREVGIRKAMGSIKKQLIFQFLTESILFTFFAMLGALILMFGLIPYFNQLTSKNISFSFFTDPQWIFAMVLLSLLVGILAGIYPAFFLSASNPIKVLKGSVSTKCSNKKSLRSGLIVFQFFISTALIIATIIIYKQLHFMQNKKLGYDKEQVLFIPDARLLGKDQDAFKQQVLMDNRVVSASISRDAPIGIFDGTEIYPKNNSSNGTTIHANIYHVDYDYLPTLGINILYGRNFLKNFPSDSAGVIVNETAVRKLGLGGIDPIGKYIVRSGQHQFEIVGVVSDFHYVSLKQDIAPLMMLLGNNYGGLILKIKTKDINGFLTDLKKQWNAFSPLGPLCYNFLDNKFASLYEKEQRTQQIFSFFTIIAIIIASLGLFGLSAFVIEQRTKEIGIRKVLGASVTEITFMLSKEFTKWVLIGNVIAWPVTFYFLYKWLEDFAYKMEISLWIFVISGLLTMVIALVTVGWQAVKAALANPVDSLRSE
jgi:putative ABC transport system permease protein